MKNKNEVFIDIISDEAPDFDVEMSCEEKSALTASVLERIKSEKKQQEKNKIVRFRRRVISLIAAALLLVVSTTAIATISSGKLKIMPKKATETPAKLHQGDVHKVTEVTTSEQSDENSEDNHSVKHEKANGLKEDKVKRKSVYLDAEKLQNYTMIQKKGGWYSFENQDNTLNFDCQVIYADMSWSRDYIVDEGLEKCKECIPDYQWTFVGDKKALYVKYEKDWVYYHQLFVQYKKTGFSLNIVAPYGISKATLKEIAQKLELKVCSEGNGSEYVKFSEYLKNYSPDKMKGEIPFREEVDYSKVKYINDVATDSQLQYKVESVAVYDNISSFLGQSETVATDTVSTTENTTESTNKFSSQIAENSNLFTYSDGTLSLYTRSYVLTGDGFNIPEQKIVYQNVQQKFCTVKLRIKNITCQALPDLSLMYPLRYVSENEDYYYDTDVYSRPVGINSCQTYNQPKYFNPYGEIVSLEAGQEQLIELGYFVDSDSVDNMFMSISDYYVDIRN